MAFIPTYHRQSCLGWTHAVHPRGSFPCLHCGWRRMTAHALILRSFHHSRAPCPRSAGFGSLLRLRLFGHRRVSCPGVPARPGSPCSHSAPAPPKSLGNTKVKRREGRKRGRFGLLCQSANLKADCAPNRNMHLSSIYKETADLRSLKHWRCALDVHCIHACVHFFVPLPHKELAHFFLNELCNLSMGEKKTSTLQHKSPLSPIEDLVSINKSHVTRSCCLLCDRLHGHRHSLQSELLSCELLHNCGEQCDTMCPGTSLFGSSSDVVVT